MRFTRPVSLVFDWGVRERIFVFVNGLATLTFPGSFKVESGTVRFEIQYTAHLKFKKVGVQVSLAGVNYDNFKVVCL